MTAAAVSPLAPAGFPALPPIAGVRLAAFAAGIRYAGRDDLMLAELAPGSTVAGVFTQSTMPGQPVTWCRECLPRGRVRAIVVNSGNANVFTGRSGWKVVESTAAAAAPALRLRPARGLRRLDRCHRRAAARRPHRGGAPGRRRPARRRGLGTGGAGDHDHRHLSQRGDRDRRRSTASPVRINGFAKGSGMIAPDMATMLAFLFTDAALPAAGAAAAARRRERALVQLRSRSTATPRPATRCCCARRARRVTPRSRAPTTTGSPGSAPPSMRS